MSEESTKFRALKTRFLLALNKKAREDGGNIYGGTVSPEEMRRRRSLRERQKASRKVNR